MIYSIQNTALTVLETKYDTFRAKHSIADTRTKAYNYKIKPIKNCFVVDTKTIVSILGSAAQEQKLL